VNTASNSQISAIIPTLNEATELPETLRRLRQISEVTEITVSDGGSTDATEAIARQAGARFLTGPCGRGGQLRRGAQLATGDVLLFLHADTWLPKNAGAAIAQVLAGRSRIHSSVGDEVTSLTLPGEIGDSSRRLRPSGSLLRGQIGDQCVVGGAFRKAFRDPHWLMVGSELRCRLRMRCLQFAYADQAIFVRREVLERIGGVPDVPLMEEHLLCRALHREGRLALADATVTTSARRFRERGVLQTYWRMFSVNLRWHLGASPEELARLYARR
jgi:glycosyltransferase involved in cell wall biosynthesis